MKAIQAEEQQERDVFRQVIIIVEDDPDHAEALNLLLQTEQVYRTVCFRDGTELLANLDSIKQLSPALFVLDYRLPSMTGLELYERLHLPDWEEEVPAIILSALSLNDTEIERLLQHCLVFIPKPYNIADLLATIELMTA